MDLRKLLTVIGAGLTTFLLVAVGVIEALDMEFSAIIGLPVGLLAGLVVLVILWSRLDGVGIAVRRATSAYATVGLAVLVFMALRYVNIGRDVLTIDVITGLSIGLAAIVYGILWLSDRNQA